MARIIVLDEGPVSLLACAVGHVRGDACRQWAADRIAEGAKIHVPEIADYEVRRELTRTGNLASIRRLDRLGRSLLFARIERPAMLLAALLWAQARQLGGATAHKHSLDADCILAAQALRLQGPGDDMTIASVNVRHLGLFADARPWEQITS